MTKAITTLPEGYNRKFEVNLHNIFQCLLAVLFGLVPLAAICAMNIDSVISAFNAYGITGVTVMFVLSLIVSLITMKTHEQIHAKCMESQGAEKVKTEMKNITPNVSSESYFYKYGFIFSTLAPALVLGGASALIALFMPASIKLFFIFEAGWQLSGGGGDFYTVFLLTFFPKDSLVKDDGTKFSVYVKEN